MLKYTFFPLYLVLLGPAHQLSDMCIGTGILENSALA